MKNILLVLIVLMFASCKKESFDYKLYQPKVDEVDSIYFSAGANSLIADGKAALQFVVEAYRKASITDENGQQKDTMYFVDYTKLPEGSLKIFDNDGKESGLTYSTTNLSAGVISFFAQIGNKKSEVRPVTLRPAQVVPEKWTVDVIFHVFELNPNDPTYDDLTYQNVTGDLLEEAVADVNKVFNNQLGNDPNGGTTNIEYRLATVNPGGAALSVPGLDKIVYDKSWRQYATFYTPTDFTKKINTIPSYTWNPEKYLNIYVIPSGANNSMGDTKPKYQIVGTGDTVIAGIASVITDKTELPTDKNYETYGVGVPRTLLFPGTGRRIELSPYLGTYYGLMRTAVASPSITDWCNDTRKYIGTNQFQSLVKVGIDGMKFLANNAMDDNRYPSLRNSFTLDQVNRIRTVMVHCPNRMHWKP